MKFLKRQYLATVSPLVLAAAFSLLGVIISVFAVNNYQRDKALMTDILLEKGVTLIRFVASSARNSLYSGLRKGQNIADLWPGSVQRVLEHASEHPGVTFLALVDSKGVILANSIPEERERKVTIDTQDFLAALDTDPTDARTYNFRINKDNSVFQVAAFFPPMGKRFQKQAVSIQSGLGKHGEMGNRMMRQRSVNSKWHKEIEALNSEEYVILVELDMNQFNERLQRKKLEIIILSIVLLLIGFGGWLSILTLEGLKGSQSRLRRVEAFSDILISSLPIGLIATDIDGGIIVYNKFSQELTGVSEQQALGGDAEVFAGMPDIYSAFTALEEPKKQIYQKEVQLISDTGEQHTVQLSRLSIVGDDKSRVGVLLIMQDLSQVKKLEKDLRRSERLAALGKMAAGVAHELRNPLSSIKGLALVLQSRFTGENQDRETATILVQEVERLNRSISELLDYARPQTLQKIELDLHNLLNKALSLLSIDAEASAVKIATDFQEKLPTLQADADKMNQVFLNLFLNAIQAMESGGTLSVSTITTERSVKIMIADTGCGIETQDLGRIFDPYFTTKPEGTGLGMAMSSKIVEEHGGSITLTSEINQGTLVVVEIPRF